MLTALMFVACGGSDNEPSPNDSFQIPQGTQEVDLQNNSQNSEMRAGSIIDYFYEPQELHCHFASPSQNFDDLFFLVFSFNVNKAAEGFLAKEIIYRPKSQEYQEHVRYYGDTAFNGLIYLSTPPYDVSAMPLNSINIVADKDFDAEHPAGSLLNDIFTLEYASAYNLIQSNYDPEINIHQRGHYQKIPLSDFKPLILPCYTYHLYFNKLPDVFGTYEFTISFDYGEDPVSGRSVVVAPVKVSAEFTDQDFIPNRN